MEGGEGGAAWPAINEQQHPLQEGVKDGKRKRN
jgi:hypothetical protein